MILSISSNKFVLILPVYKKKVEENDVKKGWKKNKKFENVV